MGRLLAALVMVLACAGAALADDRAACIKVGDPDPRIRACTNIIVAGRESRENVAMAYNNRGSAYAVKGDHDRAIADYSAAIRLNPQLALAYGNRGIAYTHKGDLDRAIADETKAIQLKPDFAEAYRDRGAAYGEKGDHNRVIADETEAIRLNPQLAEAYFDRGDAYGDKGDYDRAIADLDHAIRLRPDFAEAYRDRGVAYINMGGRDRATADFDDAIRLNPRLANAVAEFKKQFAAKRPAVPPAAPASQAASAPLGRRVALVIGNGAYQNTAQLANPTKDAKLISDALRQDGFGVTLTDNLDHDGLIKALRAFAREADTADWAVVYFAGHGLEMGGTNYLIPIDAKLLTDRDVDFEAVPLGQVMSAIDGAHALRVVILDACRSSPFADALKRTGGGGRDIGRGLARIEPARGTMVVYSAKEGTIAADGAGADSPFATALARHLTEPGIEVDKLFRLVRDDVLDATGNKQEPFVYGSLPGRQDFYFRSGAR